MENTAQLPFEVQYYLTVSGEKKTNDPETVRWFVQREKIAQLKEKGMPDHLRAFGRMYDVSGISAASVHKGKMIDEEQSIRRIFRSTEEYSEAQKVLDRNDQRGI